MSASGVASARIGAIACAPASASPAKTIGAITTGLPCCSAGMKGIGGAFVTFAIIERSSGAASAAATSPVITSALAGSTSIPPTTRSISWSRNRSRVATPKLPPPPRSAQKRSAWVSSSTSRISPSAVTTSAREEVVDREPVLADEEADAAAQGDPAEADGGRVAKPGGEAVFAGRLGVVAGLHAGLRPCGAALGVDLDRVHRGEVEDDPALGRPVPRAAVAAAAHRELGAGLAREVDDAGRRRMHRRRARSPRAGGRSR